MLIYVDVDYKKKYVRISIHELILYFFRFIIKIKIKYKKYQVSPEFQADPVGHPSFYDLKPDQDFGLPRYRVNLMCLVFVCHFEMTFSPVMKWFDT